ncbi:hypothetical protein [Haladaptatus sp. CMSO5]|uniref:hypothetical protein n=1 Tax=Haladaptatus sp. CMSO5 TaxID=3120514 RepID=UPI002FCE2DA5
MSPGSTRRHFLTLASVVTGTAIAGCNAPLGGSEYYPITIENDHDQNHMVVVSITIFDDHGLGFSTAFNNNMLVGSGRSHEFEEGIPAPDSNPEYTVLVMLENETTNRLDFTLDNGIAELKIQITAGGEIEIQPVR